MYNILYICTYDYMNKKKCKYIYIYIYICIFHLATAQSL